MTKHTKIWRIPKPNPALQDLFALKLGVSRIVAQILINRGITTLEEARVFLSPDTRFLHDPFMMKDMDEAVSRIRRAIADGERIRIFGDYDVDGITSTALLVRLFREQGAEVDYYIPARLTEGYGLNKEAVRAASAEGISLIVTVDSGISAVEEVALAGSLGIDTIVTDHHEPPEQLPQALAIVNPKQQDCRYPFKHLSGVGVACKLGQALAGDVVLDKFIELVCLGTVADIVPLKGENRILVKNGLKSLTRTNIVGVQALLEQCGIGFDPIDSRQVAFQLAPRINAAGRMGDASLAVKLFLTEDLAEASYLASELCRLNERRQAVEAEIYQETVKAIEAGAIDLTAEKVIVLAGEGWHHGVIGIVASKLVQNYHRPVVLLSIEGPTARGSARSIGLFNIYEALKSNEQYLQKYGGHHQAAGLTLVAKNIMSLREGLNRFADETLSDEDLLPEVYIDSVVKIKELDETLYRQLQMLAPYGCENPGPVLACRQTGVLNYRTVGADGSHLKMTIRDNQLLFDAIAFNMGGRGTVLTQNDSFDIVFALEKNEWNGKSALQLNIRDFKPSSHADNPFTGESGIVLEPVQEQSDQKNTFIEELFRNAVMYLSDEFYRDIAARDEFYTKVVGVTFENRQEVVAGLREGEKLTLIREPANPHDANAVRVENGSGVQLGYLNARLAKHFAQLLDRGEQYVTYVSQVTGGIDRNYGVNIVIQKVGKENSEEYREKLFRIRQALTRLPDGDLMNEIRQALLGGNPYREKQLEALRELRMGHNTLAIFGTGRGKSAVFQSMAAFKALREWEMTVIIYPLRALVNDQYENMSSRLGSLGLRVFKGNGSISAIERAELFAALEKGEADVLLTTPEFLSHHAPKISFSGRKVGLFVVDESHHIGMSSQAHRPLYKRLGELARTFGNPTVLAVTATADDDVADEIFGVLGIQSVIIDPYVRTNLRVVDNRDWPDKHGYLKKIVNSGEKTIIYVNSRVQSVELAAMLRETVPHMAGKIIFYHAGLTSEQRNTIEKMFRTGEVAAVVSTSAFGEGIDIPDIKNIVVFHLNFSFTEFNQQCGRAGRDGEAALVHLLCGRRDAAINEFILETSSPDRDNLIKLYLILREISLQSQPVTASNEEISTRLKAAGVRYARPNMVTAGLGILEELGLIRRETIGRDRQIYLLPVPEEKLNLESSMRYLEGQEEKKAFREFKEYFFGVSSEELLDFINRPIYPGKYLDHHRTKCDIIYNN